MTRWREGGQALLEALALLDVEERRRLIDGLPPREKAGIHFDFAVWAHAQQQPPLATEAGEPWRTWVIMAGRGFGKTRAGAEWVLGLARGEGDHPGARHGSKSHVVGRGSGRAGRARSSPALADAHSGRRIALVAATVEEARAIMVEGPSGIMACAQPTDIREWSPARRTIRFASGAQAFLYSGASPEGLRGPEHDFAWCDELAKWTHARDTWDNLSFGLRRGDWPRALVTTTPKAGTVLDAILELPDTVRTGGATRTNIHLPKAYVTGVEARYAGTRLGRQELDGVLLTDVEGSLWPKELIEASRVAAASPFLGEGECAGDLDAVRVGAALPLSPALSPEGERGMFSRIVIGVDPPASVSGTCGIVVCGLDREGRGVVLHDASVTGRSPEGWARAVADAAAHWGADRVVVERNQGGDMVTSVLRAAQATLPIRTVHASRGKVARAEPVATLFESGRAVFAGVFPELEAELAGLQVAGGYCGPGGSPDRADAMVWALWALLLGPQGLPRVRRL